MEDGNTGQVQTPVIDFSTIIPGMPKLGNQEITSPEITGTEVTSPEVTGQSIEQAEAPQNEFIIVDGEKIEVNLNEVIGENPDGSPRYLRDTDNPKSYKYYQSKDTKKERRIKELEEMVKSIQKPAEVKTEPQPEPPKLLPKPIKPRNYDETEAITDPESPSGIFLKEDRDYKDSVLEVLLYENSQLKSFKGQIETEKAEQLKSKEQLAHEAYQLGLIQEVGADINEAQEVQREFAIPKNDKEFAKELLEFHRWRKGQKTSQAQQKIDQFNKNGQRQAQYLPPPGVIGSQSAPEESTFGDLLVETVKKHRI